VSNSGGKILVIRGGAIGDFILTLPVLAALRTYLPQARIEVLGYRHVAQLALAGGLAHDVRSIEARPLAGFFAQNGDLSPELQEYFSSFAVIVSYLFDPDGVFRANVASCSKAQFIAGPHRPDEQGDFHATATFLKPLERLAIFDADPIPRLPAGPPKHARVPGLLAVHPGSGAERKNWPEEKWSHLIQELIGSTACRLLLIGGEAEETRLERLAASLPASRVQLAQSLPLVELTERLRACEAFIGHDSGITHLAAAVGLPLLALWGETNETVWRPLGTRIRIMRAPNGLASLPVDSVRSELARFLERAG
jgi:heptosyltransferase-3